MFKNSIITVLLLAIMLGGGVYLSNNHKSVAVVPAPTIIPATPKPVSNDKEFGTSVVLTLNKKVTFSDGLVVILTTVDDSRCPKNVQCIWEGELGVTLEVSKGAITSPGEVHMGTVTRDTARVENYAFSLKSATANSATIVVEYKKP
jgi:hypothetical protein